MIFSVARCLLLASVATIGIATPLTALAAPGGAAPVQDTPSAKPDVAPTEEAGAGDIVVTARRRDETLISVPVTVTAQTGATLAARGITSLEGFARTIPQLFLTNTSAVAQGGAVGLRGISAGDGNVFGDQAVAFNVDGVQVARSSLLQLAGFDLQQIQVLKGPQALYFGKNSPGGIIAIDSADPTNRLQAGATASYEFNAQEVRGEGFISGPLTDSLGGRIAVFGSTMRGWVHNIATPGTLYSPKDNYAPGTHQIAVRGTLKFANGGPFTARFKFAYGSLSDQGVEANAQRVYCPLGAGQLAGPDDCTPDNRVSRSNVGTVFGTGGTNTVTGANIPGVYVFGNGVPYQHSQQYLTGLQLGYKLTDKLQLASNTGFYEAKIQDLDNVNVVDGLYPYNPVAGPASATGILASYAAISIREISQEARLTSSYDGPLNFMLGGYYQDQKLGYLAAAAVNAVNPIQLFPPSQLLQQGTAYSFFGSLNFKPTSTIELSGGARYSHEQKDYEVFRILPGTLRNGSTYVAGQQVPTTVPTRTFHNVSPEATVTWRPTNRFTTYFGWKRGFLSGGFNAAGSGTTGSVIPDNSYNQEVVQGFEGGVKVAALQGKLRFNVAAYSYKIIGLQSAVNLPGPPTVQLVTNAASARSKGAEADVNWQTPVAGLTLRGSVAYNSARYGSYTNSPCYGGQTIGGGCNGGFNGTVFTNQNLTGRPLVRAPDWGGTGGATYEIKTASGGTLSFLADGNYTSKFFTDTVNSPGGLQRGYWLLDASTHYRMANGFEIAFIGRNLTNEYYFQRTSASPLSGGPSGKATSFQADQSAYVSRGRELRIQLSYRFQ